jgi:RNA polymerase sigma factor for flagellar operon FliA
VNAYDVQVRPSLTELLPIVDSVVAQLSRRLPAFVAAEDLASAGKIALIEATRVDRGLTSEALRAYCFTRVRGAVLDELRRLDPLSRESRQRVRLIQRTVGKLEVSLGRAPSLAEVAEATGLSAAIVQKTEALADAAKALSLDADELAGGVMVEDTVTQSPAHLAESADLLASLHEALSRLPVKQAYVLRRVYLEDAEMGEVAVELQVSLPRVHQLRTAGEKHLKADLLLAIFS